jgi:polyhydroxybutyrate depolymerase
MNKARRLAPVFAALVLGACSSVVPGGARIESGGVARAYRLVAPQPANGAPRPLLIALHGWLGTADQMARMTGLTPQTQARGIAVAYPQAQSRAWAFNPATASGRKDIAFIADVAADLDKQTPVDPGRVAITGFSNGGFMAQALACANRLKLTGIAVVSAGMPAAVAAHCQAPPTPFLLIQGLADPVVPASGLGSGDTAILSSAETIKFWAARNLCANLTASTDAATGITREAGQNCRAATQAIFIKDAGHGWPGGHFDYPALLVGRQTDAVNATRTILNFLFRQDSKEAVLF